jgi:8-oxo-dGTP pyrophosphatase MutT (NUDIX family)
MNQTMAEQELWDLLDADGQKLGIKIKKGDFHPIGTYHLVVGIWVIAPDGRALLTKRHKYEKKYPGLWENTGGCVQAGETGLHAAVRELKEETGIQVSPEKLCLLGTSLEKTALIEVYGYRIPEFPEVLNLQPGEVADAKWVTKSQWDEMVLQGKISGAALRRMRAVQKNLEKFLKS